MLYDKIKGLLNIYDNPAYAKMGPVEKIAHINLEVTRVGLNIYQAMLENPESEYDLADITDACKRFFEDYIVPIDLPMADWIERIAERRFAEAISVGVFAASEFLQKRVASLKQQDIDDAHDKALRSERSREYGDKRE